MNITIKQQVNNWPYPLASEIRHAKENTWIETNEDVYHNQLGCLPPEYWRDGAFAVGEAAAHNNNGQPVYTVFQEYQRDNVSRFFCKDMTLDAIQEETRALIDHLDN